MASFNWGDNWGTLQWTGDIIGVTDTPSTASATASTLTATDEGLAIPTAPANVSLTTNSNSEVEITVDPPSDWGGEVGSYEIEISRDGDTFVSPSNGPTNPSGDTVSQTYTYQPNSDEAYNTQVGIDSSFQFRVRATNSAGSSSYENSNVEYTDPIPPHDPQSSRPDGNTVGISWENRSDNALTLDVERRGDTGGGFGAWNTIDTVTPEKYQVISAGNNNNDGNDSRNWVNGVERSPNGRGMNLTLVRGGGFVESKTWDTFASTAESDAMETYLDGLNSGDIVLLTVKDEASNNLTSSLITTIENRLLSTEISNLGYRHSWAIIATVDTTNHYEERREIEEVHGGYSPSTRISYYEDSVGDDARYQYRLKNSTESGRNSRDVYADYGNNGDVYFSDGFESGDLSAWDSTFTTAPSVATGTHGDTGISGADDGTYYMQGFGDSSTEGRWVEKNLGDLSGENAVVIRLSAALGSLDDSAENFTVEWYDGTSYNVLREYNWEYNESDWFEDHIVVPDVQLSTDNRIRIGDTTATGMFGGDFCAFDKVIVSDILAEYTKPDAPSNLSLDTTVSNEITATYTNNATFETDTPNEYKLTSDGSFSSAGSGETTVTQGGLQNNEIYDWRVRNERVQYRRGSLDTTFTSAYATGDAATLIVDREQSITASPLSSPDSSDATDTPNLASATVTPQTAVDSSDVTPPSRVTRSSVTPEPNTRFAEIANTGQLAGNNAGIANAADSTTLNFQNSYDDPVVISHMPTQTGGQGIDDNVTNITGTSADLFNIEPDLEGHNNEWHSYMVVEKGVHTTPEGYRVEAGSITTSSEAIQGGSQTFDSVQFSESYDTAPVVLATINSHNSQDFKTVAIKNVTSSGFDLSKQRLSTNASATETIGWVAIPAGVTTRLGGRVVRTEVTSSSVASFSGFVDVPEVFAERRGHTDWGWARGVASVKDTVDWNETGHNWRIDGDNATPDSETGESYSFIAIQSGNWDTTEKVQTATADDGASLASVSASSIDATQSVTTAKALTGINIEGATAGTLTVGATTIADEVPDTISASTTVSTIDAQTSATETSFVETATASPIAVDADTSVDAQNNAIQIRPGDNPSIPQSTSLENAFNSAPVSLVIKFSIDTDSNSFQTIFRWGVTNDLGTQTARMEMDGDAFAPYTRWIVDPASDGFNTGDGGVWARNTSIGWDRGKTLTQTSIYDGSQLENWTDETLDDTSPLTAELADISSQFVFEDGGGGITVQSVAVYDRVLTQSEIQNISDFDIFPSGASALYKFNEGSGTTVADLSGNGNTMSLGGAEWVPATTEVFVSPSPSADTASAVEEGTLTSISASPETVNADTGALDESVAASATVTPETVNADTSALDANVTSITASPETVNADTSALEAGTRKKMTATTRSIDADTSSFDEGATAGLSVTSVASPDEQTSALEGGVVETATVTPETVNAVTSSVEEGTLTSTVATPETVNADTSTLDSGLVSLTASPETVNADTSAVDESVAASATVTPETVNADTSAQTSGLTSVVVSPESSTDAIETAKALTAINLETSTTSTLAVGATAIASDVPDTIDAFATPETVNADTSALDEAVLTQPVIAPVTVNADTSAVEEPVVETFVASPVTVNALTDATDPASITASSATTFGDGEGVVNETSITSGQFSTFVVPESGVERVAVDTSIVNISARPSKSSDITEADASGLQPITTSVEQAQAVTEVADDGRTKQINVTTIQATDSVAVVDEGTITSASVQTQDSAQEESIAFIENTQQVTASPIQSADEATDVLETPAVESIVASSIDAAVTATADDPASITNATVIRQKAGDQGISFDEASITSATASTISDDVGVSFDAGITDSTTTPITATDNVGVIDAGLTSISVSTQLADATGLASDTGLQPITVTTIQSSDIVEDTAAVVGITLQSSVASTIASDDEGTAATETPQVETITATAETIDADTDASDSGVVASTVSPQTPVTAASAGDAGVVSATASPATAVSVASASDSGVVTTGASPETPDSTGISGDVGLVDITGTITQPASTSLVEDAAFTQSISATPTVGVADTSAGDAASLASIQQQSILAQSTALTEDAGIVPMSVQSIASQEQSSVLAGSALQQLAVSTVSDETAISFDTPTLTDILGRGVNFQYDDGSIAQVSVTPINSANEERLGVLIDSKALITATTQTSVEKTLGAGVAPESTVLSEDVSINLATVQNEANKLIVVNGSNRIEIPLDGENSAMLSEDSINELDTNGGI